LGDGRVRDSVGEMAVTRGPARAYGEAGGIPAGGWIAVLPFVAILVGVVFAITRGSSGGSHSANPAKPTGSTTQTTPNSFTPIDGCSLLSDTDVRMLTDSQGISGTVVGSRSSFSKGLVYSLTPPGPGWVTECDWTGGITVPKADPENCFWGGTNEPGITITLLQHIDQNEAAAIAYLRNTSGAALTPDHSLDGNAVGNGAAGTLTVETSFLRWSAPGTPTLPPAACQMGGGPNATLSVLFGGSRLGGGLTATLTVRAYSQWDEMWGKSPPLTALETVAQRALSRLPS